MNKLSPFFYDIISRISGQAFDPLWPEKLPFIIRGAFFILLFIVGFYLFYRSRWGKESSLRRMLWVCGGILFSLIAIKFAIFHFVKDYIPDRLIFYVLPSPRAESILWFAAPLIIFAIFLKYRKKIEALPRHQFLGALYLTFILFALSVAGIREGVQSIIDPFTRTFWEYSGYLPFVKNAHDFLGQYTLLNPQIATHMVTHPPGYILFLYFFYKIFSAGLPGLVIALVSSVGLILWPLYYFWKESLGEETARRALQIFIFVPSVVMFTATSMESFFMAVVWLAIISCFLGWKKGNWLALVSGLGMAGALFSNYLFLLLGPFFVWLIWYSLKISANRLKTLLGILYSILAFTLFFVLLERWSGYSIIDNFFVARLANQSAVRSNFESVGKYFVYLFMSLTDFALYLGIPFLCLFFTDTVGSWKKSALWFKVGVAIMAFFLIIGVFQGETARLWLFLTPFFVLGNPYLYNREKESEFNAFLAITVFQIIVIQTLFFTYW
ncbi:MAG: hypothetical protein A2754_03590 [Candidatus Magasanikbacteria bacterium RIFCSPHIGHO2_01_FULL_47_8]|uniref:Glycosyltransferase RgtA/B/C/D-like domain-containing protein n=1 Tax=Candidatus Magasanikbacteria bacterium RIFCSPHIGHO2_01_FULL_47_8 TaxID=1798673 RepID=A0A1F6MDM0_9BACT|nr:MAG: hypothetical protein A2754_03590 [Candidatus Magasanikbacteria bacterium RIFCSPHIGHO2_01_FULL_47_8]